MEMKFPPLSGAGVREGRAGNLRDELYRLFGFVRRQILLVAIGAGVAAVLAAIILLNTVPTYRSQIRLLFSEPPNFMQADRDRRALGEADEYIATQIALIESRSIAERVVKELNLGARVDEMHQSHGLLSSLSSLFSSSEPKTETPQEAESADERAIAYLQSNLAVFRIARSYVIEIGFDSSDPTLAREVADAYGKAFLADQVEGRLDGLSRISKWLEVRIEEIGRGSREAAEAVTRFRAANGLVAADGRLVTDQQLEGLNQQLINARASVSAAQAQVEIYSAAIKDGNVQTLIGLRQRGSSNNANSSSDIASDYLLAAERERAVIARWGADNPQAKAITAEKERLADQIRAEARRTLDAYQAELARSQSELAAINKNVDAATAKSEGVSSTMVQLRTLEQRAQSYQSLYQNYLDRYQELIQQRSLPIDTARIITTAVQPDSPLFPKYKIVMALSLVLGGALGAAVGVGREFFDRSLRGRADVEAHGVPFLGFIPALSQKAGLLGGVSPDKADRILDRTLQRLLVATDAMRLEPMVIAITPLENDKAQNQSFIAKAYADELAKLGHEVLLIARNPERASTAAAGALARHSARSLVAEPGSHQNPTVIPAGNLPVLSQSANRTGVQTLGSSVSGLSGRFDRVVIESTSLEQALHVSALLPSVDRFIVLARWGSIPRQSLTEAIRSVHGLRAKCSGVVLDEADLSKVV
ncbi:GumC family protein [Aureimonas sp. D3]|uniref:GumC family protein n=1 Tax=Aureimonas sp. D3 TaxID=1638164 RepID=UPI0007859A7F|nr:exopolysaccharide transport family protein [Aureimonas sp. D3]